MYPTAQRAQKTRFHLLSFGPGASRLDGRMRSGDVYLAAMTRVIFILLVLLSPLAMAEPDIETQPPSQPVSKPDLSLDRLLRPSTPSVVLRQEQHGGKDREQWRDAFENAAIEVRDLGKSIANAQDQIRQAQSHEWGYSPTGGGDATDPEVLRLRAQLRRDRQSLEAAQQRLRDLDVEASLAGVPTEWREYEIPEPTVETP